jgi:hypothetical protein
MSERHIIEPLYVAVIGGHPLRFFRTPLNDGRPDLPWVAIDDVGRCLRLSRAVRRTHLRAAVRAFEGIARSIATPDGPITIVPHTLTLAAIEALVDRGKAFTSGRDEYARACADACMKLGIGPFPSPEASNAWAHVALNRWSPGQTIAAPDLTPFLRSETIISEHEILWLAMRWEGNKANMTKSEMIAIVTAWYRGKLLPRSETPILSKIYERAHYE